MNIQTLSKKFNSTFKKFLKARNRLKKCVSPLTPTPITCTARSTFISLFCSFWKKRQQKTLFRAERNLYKVLREKTMTTKVKAEMSKVTLRNELQLDSSKK